MARGGQGEPTDWVTRAADDAVRHAGEGKPVTVSSGASPSGPVHLGNLREFLTVHFVADELHRRGVAGPAPARVGRLRPLPPGAGRRRPGVVGAHRPAAVGRAGPVGVPRLLGRALQGAAARRRWPSSASRWRRSPRPSGTAPGVYRSAVRTAIERRDEIEAILARHRTRKEAEPVESDAEEDPPVGPSDELARFPFKPYCSSCGRDTLDLTDFTDPVITYTCRVCGYHGRFDIDTDTDGKLVWKVDWPMRWAFEHVDFEPAGDGPRDPRLVVHRRPRARGAGLRDAAPGLVRLRLRRLRRRAEDVVLGRRGAHRRRRAADPRGADPALALRPPAAAPGLQHRLRARGGPAVRRVGRPGPQGCDQARTWRCSPSSGPPRRRPPEPCRPRRWWCRSGRSPRSPT